MQPTIVEIVSRIHENSKALGITLYEKATEADICSFEQAMGIKLPVDFKTFYQLCNGFESDEDLFRMLPLDEIIGNSHDHSDYLIDPKDFYIAEYMIYCDMWSVNINKEDENKYAIYYKSDKNIITLTNSLSEFLVTFLDGGVFKGLYHWHEGLENKKV